MFRNRIRVELQPPEPPTLEDEMAEFVAKMERSVDRPAEAIRHYAPPQHADRVSATSQAICDGIDKVFAHTVDGTQERIDELARKVEELDRYHQKVKETMRVAADGLKERVQEVMSNLEDITLKMQESPFNGALPKFLETSDETRQTER
jgi:methyl-accepting chemotaxis protein